MLARTIKHLIGLPLITRALTAGRDATVVLCYHDLRDENDPPSWLRVPQTLFQQQLEALGSMGVFIGPEQLDVPGRGVRFLVTFDDGYRNNLRLALPVLEFLEVPAVFFVTTANLLSGDLFWFDRVAGTLLLADAAEVDLTDHGLGRFPLRRQRDDLLWDDVNAVLEALKGLGNEDDPSVAAVIEALATAHPAALAAARERYRPLNPDELQRLARHPLVQVGSHACDHAILPYLEADRLDHQLSESRHVLETLLGQPVTELAYPNGDHDAEVRRHTVNAGYTHAYALGARAVPPAGDPFAVPRLLVGGFDTPGVLRFKINRLLVRTPRR